MIYEGEGVGASRTEEEHESHGGTEALAPLLLGPPLHCRRSHGVVHRTLVGGKRNAVRHHPCQGPAAAVIACGAAAGDCWVVLRRRLLPTSQVLRALPLGLWRICLAQQLRPKTAGWLQLSAISVPVVCSHVYHVYHVYQIRLSHENKLPADSLAMPQNRTRGSLLVAQCCVL